MRTFGRILGWLILLAGGLAAALALLVWLAPAEAPLRPAAFDATQVPADPGDLDAWLAAREAVIPGIVPGTEKRIVWAGEPGTRTPLALVYLHGFSATSEETRPMPDRAAEALGANLFFARLAGHGRDGEALAAATAEDWMTDLAEALAIGSRIGERIVLIGTSTGGTLALAGLGLRAPGTDAVAGVVFISPNLRLASPAGRLLDLPGVERWGHLLVGRNRSFAPINEGHAEFWTEAYPTAALYPMARLMRAARAVDPARLTIPALFVWSDADRVVDAASVRALADAWAGPVTRLRIDPGPGIDPYNHVLAGNILSPAATERVAAALADWARALP
jgi:alpha-beta hydrolase superfamily lysophospholipase